MANREVKYGEKGENGVIEITTKSSSKPTNKMGKTIVGFEIDTTNLSITVDGDQVMLNGEKVDPKDPRLKKIKRINVLGGQNSSPLMGVMLDPLAPEAPPAPMNKAFLGVSTETSSEGALVVEVSPESPAAKAGLAEDDIITQVNKDPIKKQSDLYAAIGKYKEGDKVTIEYLRDGKKNKKEIVLAKNKMEARTEVYEFVPDNFNQNFNKDFNKNFKTKLLFDDFVNFLIKKKRTSKDGAIWKKIDATNVEQYYKTYGCDFKWAEGNSYCESTPPTPVDDGELKKLIGVYKSDQTSDGQFRIFDATSTSIPNSNSLEGKSSIASSHVT